MPRSPTNVSPVANSAKSTDLLADFLRLRGNANTSHNYDKSLADFCRRIYDTDVSTVLLTKFLLLPQSEAVYITLQYRQLLIEAKLAPNTINLRLSALKSFVDYARRNERCKLSIIGKGKLQKTQIDLSPATTIAIAQWLAQRLDYQLSDPLFTSLDNRSHGHR